MKSFHLKTKFFIFLVGLILGMIALQIIHKKTRTEPLTQISFLLFSEIQTFSVNFHQGLSHLVKKYLFLLRTNEKNTELKKENEILRAKQEFFQEILKENARLKDILRFPLTHEFDLLPAQIVGTDFLSKSNLLTINKGHLHGIKKFMGVIHPYGVVGYVFRVGPHSSQIISLISPLSSLPARNNRSRITGLIEAYKTNLLLFNPMQNPLVDTKDKALQTGDKIITVKSDQFPAGLLVGYLISLQDSPNKLNPMAYVKPAVHFYSLEEVLVVLNTKRKPSPPVLQNSTSTYKNQKSLPLTENHIYP